MSQTTSNGALGRASALMASGTAVSRVLGLLRGMVLVAAIGATGQAANAFAVANKPNIIYMLVAGGVLNAVLVPQIVRAYKRDGGKDYVDRLLTVGVVVLGAVAAVLTLAASLLVDLYGAAGAPRSTRSPSPSRTGASLELFFYGAYTLLGQVLNARSSFGPYMWAPGLANNLISITGLGVFIAVFGVATSATWTRVEREQPPGGPPRGHGDPRCRRPGRHPLPAIHRAGVRWRRAGVSAATGSAGPGRWRCGVRRARRRTAGVPRRLNVASPPRHAPARARWSPGTRRTTTRSSSTCSRTR